MCSLFWKRMDNDQGDLGDIVRASGGTSLTNPVTDWQFPIESMNFPVGIDEPNFDFSDPISNIHDPLLHELDIASSVFFHSSEISRQPDNLSMMVTSNESDGMILDQEVKPYHLFSKMLQISPKMAMAGNNSSSSSSPSPRGGSKSTGVISNEMIKTNNSLCCSVEKSSQQLSSPRNTGIKRRKSQLKKVVCIPAPAAANSRPTGEVVPSDLWAWRKYGQKPIKGSPYPRGYYRCSSSKGCSARKQVERSRTDPNMLVITYTSDHNHPWPTQRNALAGSTRSQPLKNSSSSKISPSSRIIKPANVKEEGEAVKKEMGEDDKPAVMNDQEFEQSLHHGYRPIPPDDQNQSDDFFAELGELESDPVNLMFISQGFTEEKTEEQTENRSLDPFRLFDWSGN